MIINRLKLHNFLSHNDTDVSLEKGVNVIIGKNGAGKSSIIDGMKFAFLGERRGSKIEDLIKRGKTDCSVSLDFTIGNHNYLITRQMSVGRNGNVKDRDAALVQDGVEIARHVSGVDKAIEDPNYVGINKEVFLNSVFVEQGEIDALVSSAKSEREKIFGKIVGLDVLSEYTDELKTLRKDLEVKRDSLLGIPEELASAQDQRNKIGENIQQITNELSAATQAASTIKTELDRTKDERDDLFLRLNKINADLNSLEQKKRKMLELEGKIKEDSKKIDELSSQADAYEKRIDRTLLLNRNKVNEYLSTNKNIAVKRELLNKSEEQISSYNKMMAELQQLKETHERYLVLKKEIDSNEVTLEKLKSAYEDYKRKLQLASGEKEEMGKIEKRISIGKDEIQRVLGVEIEDRRKLEDTVNEKRGAFQEAMQQKSAHESEVRDLDKQKKTIEEKIESISGITTCPLCQQPITDEHRVVILNGYNDEVSEKNSEIEKSNRLIKEIDNDLNKLNKIMGFINSRKINDFYTDTENYESRKGKYDKLNDEIKNLEPDYLTYTKIQKENDLKKKELKDLEMNYHKYESLKMNISGTDIGKIQDETDALRSNIVGMEKDLQKIQMELGFIPNSSMLGTIQSMDEFDKKIQQINVDITSLRSGVEAKDVSLSDLNKEIQQLGKSIELKPVIQNEYNKTNGKLEDLRRDHENALGNISKLNTRKIDYEEQIKNIDIRISELTIKQEKLEKLSRAITEVEKLRQCFDRDGLQKAIRKDSAEFLTLKVMDYADSFNLNFDDVKVSEDMNIEISQNGQTESIDMLSGGEKTALSIALRLALAKYVMENIKTMIMDEPTTYLDQDRRSNLKDIIQYTFSSEDAPVPQMIIVTHHTDLYTAADNVLEVVKQNGNSTVTSVI